MHRSRHHHHHRRRRTRRAPLGSPTLAAVLAVLLAGLLAGCAVGADDAEPSGEPSGSVQPRVTEVVVATHDSWAAPDELIAEFESTTGYQVTVVPSGDAGALTNKLVLTKSRPIADVVYGVDNTFASRAVDEGVFAEYRSADLPVGDYDIAAEHLTPVDWSDVCVNVDDGWFAERDIPAPRTLEDLAEPRYRDLFVTPGASTSSPGFAFLLATIGEYGDDWQEYWERLMANGTKLTSGWEDAYYVDFTQGGGDGKRPIVLSYASSPPFTIPKGKQKPTTSALLDTCFRQVEYAGVLDGARNELGAQAFVDFLVGKAFQESLPDGMYVFPVRADAQLPPVWAKWAKPAPTPIEVPADEVSAQRSAWLTEWSEITTR